MEFLTNGSETGNVRWKSFRGSTFSSVLLIPCVLVWQLLATMEQIFCCFPCFQVWGKQALPGQLQELLTDRCEKSCCFEIDLFIFNIFIQVDHFLYSNCYQRNSKDSHNTGNFTPYSFRIVLGLFNVPHYFYTWKVLLDGAHGL